MTSAGVLRRRWAKVVGWAFLIWLSGPLLPALRRAVQQEWGHFEQIVLVGTVIALVVACGVSLRQAGGRRLRLLAGLSVLALLAAAAYFALGSSDPRSRMVEAAHLLEYGVLGFLAFRALGDDEPFAPRLVLGLVVVAAVGLVDECNHWLLASRYAEIRDVALNVTAGLLGLFLAALLRTGEDRKAGRAEAGWRRVLWAMAVLVLGLGAFLQGVHLAHRIEWDDLELVSQFTARELDRLSRDRRQRWAGLSETARAEALGLRPGPLLALEDPYVTEARAHVQARNEAATQGDEVAAAAENLILERWYGAYLDFAAAGRQDIREVASLGGYQSPVLAHLWPDVSPRRLWMLVITVEAVLLAAGIVAGPAGRTR